MDEESRKVRDLGVSLPSDAEVRKDDTVTGDLSNKNTPINEEQETFVSTDNKGESVENKIDKKESSTSIDEKKQTEETNKILWPDTYHCRTCRSNHPGSLMIKRPIEFRRDEFTGEVKEVPTRFTLFCGKCDGYLGITDRLKAQE